MSGFTGGGSRPPMKDPFGLPTDEEDAYQDDGEFDLSQLEPKMRSIAIAPPAMPQLGPRMMHQPQQCYQPLAPALQAKPSVPQPDSKPVINVQPVASTASAAVSLTTAQGGLVEGVAKTEELEPPALPFDCSIFPLELCHFYTSKSPKELKEDVEEALHANNVAFDFDARRFKFCCEYFTGTGVVKFNVRSYRMPDSRLVVEFQRRQGCCLACSKIVGAVRETLAPEGKQREGKDFEPRITEAIIGRGVAVSAEVVMEKLEDLRQCLTCGREEVKREFAKVLIPLSQLCPQSVRRDRAYADLVCKLVRSDADEARLAAVSCVANVAASLKEQEDDVWFGAVLDSVVMALTDRSAHVRREAARALMHMSGQFPRAILSHGGLEALRMHTQCNDRMLSGYASAAVHNLVSAC